MKYIFYRIILVNGKNKRVYKKETSIKLYCKLNGKMIDIKKYKELCKKPKTKKVKSTRTKKVKSTRTKKVKSTKTKKVKSTKTKKFKKTKTYQGGDRLINYNLDDFHRLINNAKFVQERRQSGRPGPHDTNMYEIDNMGGRENPVPLQLISFHLQAMKVKLEQHALRPWEFAFGIESPAEVRRRHAELLGWLDSFERHAYRILESRGFVFTVNSQNPRASSWKVPNGGEYSINSMFSRPNSPVPLNRP